VPPGVPSDSPPSRPGLGDLLAERGRWEELVRRRVPGAISDVVEAVASASMDDYDAVDVVRLVRWLPAPELERVAATWPQIARLMNRPSPPAT